MRELNIDFMDLYKSVDRFIRDAYRSNDGVSEYIRQMEQNAYRGVRYVATWKADYDMLKHLRRIRNQLAHEVGYDSDLCEESDYDWLEDFNNRLYNTTDPISSMNRAEKAEQQRRLEAQRQLQAQKRAEEERRRQIQLQDQQNGADFNSPPYEQLKRKTLWQRIKSWFRGEN